MDQSEIERIAKAIVDEDVSLQVKEAIRLYQRKLAIQMIAAGCNQTAIRNRFGQTCGTVLWHEIHGTKHCHKTYRSYR